MMCSRFRLCELINIYLYITIKLYVLIDICDYVKDTTCCTVNQISRNKNNKKSIAIIFNKRK